MQKCYINMDRQYVMNPSMNCILKADFKAKFELELFLHAVEMLEDAYTILRSTVEMTETGEAYLVPETAKHVSVEIVTGTVLFERLIVKESKHCFHLEEESLLRIIAVPMPNSFTVIFNAHRLLGDGKSLIIMMEQLLKAYSGRQLEHVELLPIKGPESFSVRANLSSFDKLYLGGLNKAWRKEKVLFSWDQYSVMFQSFWKEHEMESYLFSLNPVEARKIFYRTKELGVNFNSALVAAFLYARKEVMFNYHPKSSMVRLGVDIRDDLSFDTTNVVGNYSSCFYFKHKWKERERFSEMMQRVGDSIKHCSQSPQERLFYLLASDWVEGTLKDATYFSCYSDYHSKVADVFTKRVLNQSSRIDLAFDNLAKVTLLVPPEIELEGLVYVPPMLPYADISVGVVISQSIVSFGVLYLTSCMSKDMIKSICGRMKELLLGD